MYIHIFLEMIFTLYVMLYSFIFLLATHEQFSYLIIDNYFKNPIVSGFMIFCHRDPP